MWIKCKQVAVSFKTDPCSITGYIAQSLLKECSSDVSSCQNQEWTTHKKPQTFFVKWEEILISSIRATSYQNNTPWWENVLHKKKPWIHPKFSRKVWVVSSIFSWMEVKFFVNSDKGSYAWGKSSLAIGTINLHRAAKWQIKAGFPILPEKKPEWWAAVGTLLLLVALSDWFTAQCWLEDWAC